MTAYWCESAWLTGGFARRVRLVTQDGLHQGRPRRGRRGARRRAARGGHPAGHGQCAQPRLPPRPARPRQRRRRQLLELARADVCRRRAAQPRHLLRPRASGLRRDGAGGLHRGRRVPLRAPPAGRPALPRPQRDGPRACARPPTRRASGSRCSTPATSRAVSTVAATSSCTPASDASATAPSTPGPSAWRPGRPRPTGCASVRRSTPCGPCAARTCPRSSPRPGRCRCTCTSPSSTARTTPARCSTVTPRPSCSTRPARSAAT